MDIKQIKIDGKLVWQRLPANARKESHVEADGTQRPRGWFEDPVNRAAAGWVEIPTPARPDDRFYIVAELDFADTPEGPWFDVKPRTADVLAAAQQHDINAGALRYLAETDWMVTRFAETGVPIPADIKVARQAARDAIVRLVPAFEG